MTGTWVNPPPAWTDDGTTLAVRTGPRTDFWRTTHYGFVRDDGHVRGRVVAGDGSVEATFEGDYRAQYDQAGVMLRIDEETWVKAGIEHVDGVHHASVVVTRGFSDWSVTPLGRLDGPVSFRLRREAETVTVDHRAGGDGGWTMLRLAYVPPERPALLGIMCASPDGDGFDVRFRAVRIDGDDA